MKPQLGDTISNRYVLVSPLREETGLQVWKASDHVLARDCQLFIVNNTTPTSPRFFSSSTSARWLWSSRNSMPACR